MEILAKDLIMFGIMCGLLIAVVILWFRAYSSANAWKLTHEKAVHDFHEAYLKWVNIIKDRDKCIDAYKIIIEDWKVKYDDTLKVKDDHITVLQKLLGME